MGKPDLKKKDRPPFPHRILQPPGHDEIRVLTSFSRDICYRLRPYTEHDIPYSRFAATDTYNGFDAIFTPKSGTVLDLWLSYCKASGKIIGGEEN